MSSLPGFRFDVTGASGSLGLLGPKNGYRVYVFPRGGYAAQDSTGTKITFDSASVASRFSVGNWIQSGLLTSNIRQVGAVGGNSLVVSGAAVTVTENDRIYLIGNTEPTVNGGSATYTTPNTIVRQRDDDAADLYSNSMLTTNADGLVQGFAVTALYDLLIQDSNGANQGSLIDLPVGVPEGISVSDWAIFGATVTLNAALGVTGTATFGSTANIVSLQTSLFPIINVKHPTYGAKGDGATDDTTAIQAALDAANATFNTPLSGFGGAFVYFPVGVYIITATLNWKRGAYLMGAGIGPYHTTHIRWNGAAGGTMIADSGTAFSARLLEGIGFRKGTATPGLILGISGNPDWSCRIQNCNFLGSSGDLIKVEGGWINLHMRDVRFDDCGGYALHLAVGSGQNGSTFLLDGFTFDSSGTAGNGFIYFDNVTYNTSNAGIAQLSNGRIEINTTPMTNPSAVATFGVTNVGVNPRFIQFNARNVYYQDSASSANDAFLRVTGSTAASDPASFLIENCYQQNIATIVGGSWTVGVNVPLTSRLLFAAHGEAANLTVVDDLIYFQSFDSSYNVMKSTIGVEANERWKMDSAGILTRGPGSGTAPATKFLRGTGSPEGSVTAGIGSIFQREDGGAGSSMYVKETGTTSSGWAAK